MGIWIKSGYFITYCTKIEMVYKPKSQEIGDKLEVYDYYTLVNQDDRDLMPLSHEKFALLCLDRIFEAIQHEHNSFNLEYFIDAELSKVNFSHKYNVLPKYHDLLI